jgi:formylmethanofuran dehydrogenase subunit A
MDAPKKEEKEDLTGLYDLAIPLSTPITVIRELVEKFELEPVRRNAKMDMTGEVMDREILVLRGDLETVMAAKKYMFEATDRKIEEWVKNDRSEKYKKYYEARLKENALAKEQEGESTESEGTTDWTKV